MNFNSVEKAMIMQALDLLIKHYQETKADGNLLDGAQILKARMSDKPKEELFVVRLYDGMDREWMDVFGPATMEACQKEFQKRTNNGTEKTKYDGIDYFKIFPANTKMFYSGDTP